MNNRTRIKMCGTTNIEDANAAVQLGVDALGFIFTDKSPRYLTSDDAKEIIDELPPFILKVGVFVNEMPEEIEEKVHYLGLNCLQLHGNENRSYCEDLKLSLPFCSILKAVRVGDETSSADFDQYNDVIDGFLLDTYVKGEKGGTGLTFDWSILSKLNLKHETIVAGGLNPENIEKMLSIAHPFGIDVNSGVEDSPGRKNHTKLQEFIDKVGEFDRTKRVKA